MHVLLSVNMLSVKSSHCLWVYLIDFLKDFKITNIYSSRFISFVLFFLVVRSSSFFHFLFFHMNRLMWPIYIYNKIFFLFFVRSKVLSSFDYINRIIFLNHSIRKRFIRTITIQRIINYDLSDNNNESKKIKIVWNILLGLDLFRPVIKKLASLQFNRINIIKMFCNRMT